MKGFYIFLCGVVILVIAVLLPIFLVSETKYRELPDEKIDNITQVFMHQSSYFSILVRSESGEETIHKITNVGEFKLSRDVKDGLGWVVLKKSEDLTFGFIRTDLMELHLPPHVMLEGGQWSTGGKFPESYNTIVIK